MRALWGQFSFRQFLVPAYTSSQGQQAPSNIASANYRVLICCTIHFQSGSLFLFILASTVFKSLQYLTSTLTQGGGVAIYLGSLVQLCYGEGGILQTNITGTCRECSQCLGHTGFDLAHSMCALPVHTAQASGCYAGELYKVGPGLCALPTSKPLRIRFLGTPQRHRLGWD